MNKMNLNFNLNFKDKKVQKRIIWIVLLLLLGVGYCSCTGSHFTVEGAIRSNSFVKHSSVHLNQIHTKKLAVYFYENKDQYCSVIAFYDFPFWKSDCSTYIPKENVKEEKLKVVGVGSIYYEDEELTALCFQSNDEQVDYIVVKMDGKEEKKHISFDDTVVFSYDKCVPFDEITAYAYSEDGHKMYQFQYEEKDQIKENEQRRNFKWIAIG